MPRDECVADGVQPFLVAAHEHDPRAERRKLIGHLTPEPRCRAGDQHGAAGKHIGGRRRPTIEATPHGGADPRETANDA